MIVLYVIIGVVVAAIWIAWEIGAQQARQADAAHKQGKITPAEARALARERAEREREREQEEGQ